MDRKQWIVLIFCSIPLALGAIDHWGSVIAIPAMHYSLGASYMHLRLLSLAFWLPDLLVMTLAARWGESMGYRNIFLGGIFIFILTSILATIMPTIEMLIFIRIFKGIGAGLMFSPLLAIVSNAFPEEQQGRAFGLWAGLGGVFFALAPPLSGFLVYHFGWQSVYLFNALIALVGLILAWNHVESINYFSMPSHYWKGFVLLTIGLSLFSIATFQADIWGWLSLKIFFLFLFGLVILVTFGYHEKRQKLPLIAIESLSNRNFIAGTLTVFLNYAVLAAFMFAGLFLFLLYYHFRRDIIGVAWLPCALTWTIASFFTGHIADRFGLKPTIVLGLIISTFALLLCSIGKTYWAHAVALILLGIGFSLSIVAANALTMSQIPVKHRGEASGVSMTIRLLGSILGLGIFGGAFALIERTYLTEFFLCSKSSATVSPEHQRQLIDTLGLAIVNIRDVNVLKEIEQVLSHATWLAYCDMLRLMAISMVVFTLIIVILSQPVVQNKESIAPPRKKVKTK